LHFCALTELIQQAKKAEFLKVQNRSTNAAINSALTQVQKKKLVLGAHKIKVNSLYEQATEDDLTDPE